MRGAAMLPQQVDPDGQADGGHSGEKPGSEKSHYILPLRNQEVLAQRRVERAVGFEQEVIHAGGPRLLRKRLNVRVDLAAYSFLAYSGETSSASCVSMSTSSTGSRNFGRISCGSRMWNSIDFVAVKPQRLDGLDDRLRLLVEIGDHDHDAAPLQELLEMKKRLGEIGARPELRLFDGVQQPRMNWPWRVDGGM